MGRDEPSEGAPRRTYTFHFLEEITAFAEQEIAKEEATGMDLHEGTFIWRADEMHVLLKQLVSVSTFATIEHHAHELLRENGIPTKERAVWDEMRQKLGVWGRGLGSGLEISLSIRCAKIDKAQAPHIGPQE